MISKISTLNMPREDWLAERRKGIGGSDASAVIGLNKYTSPYALWAEKTGSMIPPDISDNESVRLGNDLEQYVADRWMEATGRKCRKSNYIYRNSEYPFAHANPDRIVVGERAGLECKTTSSYDIGRELDEGHIPDMWYCQCTHYMMVTGYDKWYLAVIVFGRGFYKFVIKRNDAEIAALAAAEKEFWDGVSNHTPPETDGSESTTEAIKTIFAESAPGSMADLTPVGYQIDVYNALGMQIKELERQQDAAANAIKEYMGSAERGCYGAYSVSWKESKRSTFDRKRYEQEVGMIPDQYYNESRTRTFRVKKEN